MKGELPSDRLRNLDVRDVMTTEVYSASATWSLLDAAHAMRSYHVSGLPVVDDRGTVVGVVSEKDIVRDLDQALGLGSPRGILDLLLAAGGIGRTGLVSEYLQRLKHAKVEEVMSAKPVTVEPDDTLGEAFRLMHQYTINRLPVVEKGHLLGILARQDVVNAIQTPVRPPSPKSPRHH